MVNRYARWVLIVAIAYLKREHTQRLGTNSMSRKKEIECVRERQKEKVRERERVSERERERERMRERELREKEC